jgi:hypothetical protein
MAGFPAGKADSDRLSAARLVLTSTMNRLLELGYRRRQRFSSRLC